jgi:hypothetical protein
VSHDEEFGTGRDNWESKEILFGHLLYHLLIGHSVDLLQGCDRTSARFATLNREGEQVGVNKKRPLCHDWGAYYPEVIGMEAEGMIVAKDSAAFKSIQEITERAEALK